MLGLFSVGASQAAPTLILTSDIQPSPAIHIESPEDGATIRMGEPLTIDYQTEPGFKGEYLRFEIDGREPIITRELRGKRRIEGLSPGSHRIRLLLLNRAHADLGVEASVTVEVTE